ncbi:MAG: flagellar basal body L-ring protein FlgH [Litorivicinaceae bacterium]|jgi:flagellar L-ring protein FlgH|nr:flagellar basal body L-ring protein FlgH [Litorivicinaceae bacterium]MDP5328379.1 flagellar basal body L-ring protein FlgH [Litorivicinaceae bacterium]MDP5330101.1 flagellar basal body L-ring protein FlgH [Litorivicinaceae bacterium]MDP5340290.1 flagellar basal body L-ring protein FlgH [Litorivicinaceae bacterium]MDP5341680.1 flagellar basal body L-ring protein FlgH [Litorivicinaceae bacterium]
MRILGLTVCVMLLGGCVSQQVAGPTPEFAPILPEERTEPRVATGSIFIPDQENDWFGEKKAYRVGDLVTVILSEQTQAERSANTTASRETGNDALSALQLARFGSNGGLLSSDSTLGSTIESTGSGETDQAASLSGSISATVERVLANGNLVIRGEKLLTLSEGTEVIQVQGIIRPDDVQPDNTVLSRRIANAQISYKGTGQLANAQRVPWGTNLFFSLWPF